MARLRVFILVLIVAACGQASATPSPHLTAWLALYDQVFIAEPAPSDAAEWHQAVADFTVDMPDAQVESAIYGKVSCASPSVDCTDRGLVGPVVPVPLWIITFRNTPDTRGCPTWAAVQADSGTFVNGYGPPC
jgi:hypothetical protein